MAGSSLAMMGYAPSAAGADVRGFKLARTTEHKSTCPYCSVSCGMLMYTLGDKSKNVKPRIIHIEGDPDHPVNRGTLCPKGAGVLDFDPQPEPPASTRRCARPARTSGSASPGTRRSSASPST